MAAGSTDLLPSHQPNGWVHFMAHLGVLPPILVGLAGLAAATLLPAVLHFGEAQVLAWRQRWGAADKNPWGVFWATAVLSFAGLVASAVHGARVGAHGFARAARELREASEEVTHALNLAQACHAAGLAAGRDLDALASDCPKQVQAVLGSSVAGVHEALNKYTGHVHDFALSLKDLPEAILEAAGASGRVDQSLSPWLSVLPLAVLLGCGAVAYTVALPGWPGLRERLGRFGRLTRCSVSLVAVGCVAPAIMLTSGIAAAELSWGIQSSSFCRRADITMLSSVEARFGAESDVLKLVGFYVHGSGQNPALEQLEPAKAALDDVAAWAAKYTAPLGLSCPAWAPESLEGNLAMAKQRLAKAEALLEPQQLHGHYRAAVWDAVCGRGAAGLGALATWHAFLGLVCLPAFTVSASWLVQSLRFGRGFTRLDVEDGDGDQSFPLASFSQEENLRHAYHALYAFSAASFTVGLFMYLWPLAGLVRPISGTLLLACGTFLLMNSELIVTLLRLRVQVKRFRESNERFEVTLQEQTLQVKRLRKAAQGFKEIDEQFGGDLKRAMKEVEKLRLVARTNLLMCCKQLCRLYESREQGKLIRAGAELDDALDVMTAVFGAALRDLQAERMPRLRDALRCHARFLREGGVAPKVFAELMQCTLSAEDASQIPGAVAEILDAAH